MVMSIFRNLISGRKPVAAPAGGNPEREDDGFVLVGQGYHEQNEDLTTSNLALPNRSAAYPASEITGSRDQLSRMGLQTLQQESFSSNVPWYQPSPHGSLPYDVTPAKTTTQSGYCADIIDKPLAHVMSDVPFKLDARLEALHMEYKETSNLFVKEIDWCQFEYDFSLERCTLQD